MKTLSELISRRPTAEEKRRNKGEMERLASPIVPNSPKLFAVFECDVFNFLLKNKQKLGITSIFKYQNFLVDGAVELLDGRMLTLEVKYRMNWLKACQAEWQFRTFLKRHKATVGRVDGGLVIFKEFSGDCKKQPMGRFQNGWNHWYRSHSDVDGLRLDLLRLSSEGIEAFPEAAVT
jgi:hypothetical protein